MLSVGSSSEVSLKVTETDLSNLTATIRAPSGYEEPCALKRLANGHLGISFTPREIGEHLVNVYRYYCHFNSVLLELHFSDSIMIVDRLKDCSGHMMLLPLRD